MAARVHVSASCAGKGSAARDLRRQQTRLRSLERQNSRSEAEVTESDSINLHHEAALIQVRSSFVRV